METGQTKVTSKDGTHIAYDRSGSGPAIILVGGALSDRSAGAPLAALLAPHFAVFAYDRRGRGDSGDTAPYAVEREVEDIEALIREAGGSAFAYGMSSGAVLALEAAGRGLHIPKLAMYEPPFVVDDSRPPVTEEFATQLKELLAAGRRGDAVALFLTKAVGVPDEFLGGMRQEPFWPVMERMAHTLLYDLTIMEDSQRGEPLPARLTRLMASVTAATLVMAGGASPAWLQHAAQAAADAIPGARHRTLERQTHGVAPQVLAPVLEDFFGSETAADRQEASAK